MIRLTTQSGPDALVTRSAFYLLAGSFHLGGERPLFPGHSSQETTQFGGYPSSFITRRQQLDRLLNIPLLLNL